MKLLSSLKKMISQDRKLHIIRFYERFESIFYRNDLNQLAKIFKTDKNGIHHYTQHYQFHLNQLRKQRLNLLEIGVGGYENPTSGGHSLRMWKAYFTKANIYAIDVFEKQLLEEPRIRIFKGSQVDFDFMAKISEKIGPLDIIVDDGSHINSNVIDTFKFLFPLLMHNGFYFIEDTQTSYWAEMGGTSENFNNSNSIMGYFKSLTDGLNYQEFERPEYQPNYMDLNILSIHFYHNLIVVRKGLNNEYSNFMVNNRKR